MKLLRLLSLLLAINVCGCAAPGIYVSSLTDKNYQVDKNSKLARYDPVEETIKVKNFYAILYKEMERLGFNFVPIQEADYFLTAIINENTSPISGVLPMPTSSYTSGTVGGSSFSGTTSGTTYIPYSRSYTVQRIHLTLIDLKKYTNDGKVISVWEGNIGAGKRRYKENVQDCLYTLLQYFGTDFQGHVRIARDKTRLAQ